MNVQKTDIMFSSIMTIRLHLMRRWEGLGGEGGGGCEAEGVSMNTLRDKCFKSKKWRFLVGPYSFVYIISLNTNCYLVS